MSTQFSIKKEYFQSEEDVASLINACASIIEKALPKSGLEKSLRMEIKDCYVFIIWSFDSDKYESLSEKIDLAIDMLFDLMKEKSLENNSPVTCDVSRGECATAWVKGVILGGSFLDEHEYFLYQQGLLVVPVNDDQSLEVEHLLKNHLDTSNHFTYCFRIENAPDQDDEDGYFKHVEPILRRGLSQTSGTLYEAFKNIFSGLGESVDDAEDASQDAIDEMDQAISSSLSDNIVANTRIEGAKIICYGPEKLEIDLELSAPGNGLDFSSLLTILHGALDDCLDLFMDCEYSMVSFVPLKDCQNIKGEHVFLLRGFGYTWDGLGVPV